MNTEPIALPNAIKEGISAIVKILVVFGIVQMTGEQLATLLLVVDPLMAVAATLYARFRSTPTAAPVIPADTRVTVETAAGKANGTAVLDVTAGGTVIVTPAT